MMRIDEIEGLRAWLSLWVVAIHAVTFTGFNEFSLIWLMNPDTPVRIFMIISGFVIFNLIQNKQESYLQYIIRRFFRLLPLFGIIFFLSIPFVLLGVHNAHSNPYINNAPPGAVDHWFDNIWFHCFAHLSMLHGLFPVRDAAIAFIGPGWSISVEWQFYIIAPFVYMFLKRRAVVGGLLIIMLILLRNIIDNTVFLPRYMEYFALGIGSFYLYRKRSIMVTFLLFLVSLYYFKNHPITYWMLFLCIDPRIFVNHITLYCGKISYSIYLTHTIVLYCVQFVLLQWTLSQTTHFIFLLVGTIAGTIALSSLTYRYVEKKGIEFGAALAKRVS